MSMKDKLIDRLSGIKELSLVIPQELTIELNVESIRVFPEGISAFFAVAFNEDLTLRSQYKGILESANILVVDVGAGTTDVAVIDKFRAIEGTLDTYPIGGNNVYQQVGRQLKAEGRNISETALIESTVTGYVTDGNARIDISDTIARVKEKIANALAGGSKGGPAKVAVVASGLLGMINGAAVAVVVTTGSFTIPLMKKTGYDNEFSGAIVATGSVGGQLMPPVMGAAAFIMAETLGIKYSTLLVSAIIPAVIYYMGILLQIQMRAEKMGMQGTPKDQLPKVGEVMKEYGHLAIPLVFLIYMLFFSGKTVIMAAFYTILFTIVVAQLRPNTRMSLNDIIDAMVASAKSTVSVAIACACVGIIVGVCSITGFALNMASTIIQIGGQSLMFTLMFTMVTCMILGMGLPSIPSYIITSTIAAPALVTLGIPPIAAHMFCFYFRNVCKPDASGCPGSLCRGRNSGRKPDEDRMGVGQTGPGRLYSALYVCL